MTSNRDCSERIWQDHRSMWGPCSRPAIVEHDGKWYCWQHDPEYIAEKAAERRADWQAEMDREAAKYACIARNARLGALVTPELLELLEYLAEGIDCLAPAEDGIPTPKTDEARELAARIRRALDDDKAT